MSALPRADTATLWDVAIVGLGPTGATLANMLGAAGARVIVIEREHDLLNLPRGVHFDGEVMRIFQGIGLADAIEPLTRPSGGMQYFSAAGKLLVERVAATTIGPHGWRDNYLFHQPYLERPLRAGLARYPNVAVRLDTELVAIEQDAARVTLRIHPIDGSEERVHARYAIGCDGARSLVRQVIGADHEDLGLQQPGLVGDVLLTRPVDLPPATVQYCDPERPVTFVRGTGERRRWEIMLMPGDDPATITHPDNVWRLIRRWVTPADAVLERGALYTFHSLIATRWRDRRLLIAGDSAHQTPPFLGQGMCAGIRDSANLGWKLARVLEGRAPATLLDTYQSERSAHVRHFIELAVTLGDLIQTTDPAVAATRDEGFEAGGTMALVNLSPALGAGLHTGQTPGGELLAQARLPDGRLADDVIGASFAAIGDLSLASPSARATLERIGTRFISIAPGSSPLGLQPSLHLLRPDRYTFGRAERVTEFDTLVSRLDRSLA